ncbi:Ig domain-containing protein [Streptomyces sp. URMC 129]|uniref:Ig domain-containing protein n=1 Tax=Streptomyces sp. URMC 129 TaxID=3423407 RepID=UPI003F1AA830
MTITPTPVYTRRRARPGADAAPVELRFVDLLMIVIATLMFLAITLSVVSAFSGSAENEAGGTPRNVTPLITTRAAPAAIAGQPYALTLAVEGGDGDYAWQSAGGDLPDGLSLSPDGTVAGTPERAQATRVRVRVTDGSGHVSEVRALDFRVEPSGTENAGQAPPRVVSPRMLLDDATEGEAYRHTFRTDSGAAPYQWESDDLPSGLTLSADGTLTGEPEAGTSDFTVKVTDANGTTARQEVRMDVAEGPEPLHERLLRWLLLAVFVVAWGSMVLFGGGFEGIVNKIRRWKEQAS